MPSRRRPSRAGRPAGRPGALAPRGCRRAPPATRPVPSARASLPCPCTCPLASRTRPVSAPRAA
eukprot:2262644-Pleurochrysis_carterae.AAC.1